MRSHQDWLTQPRKMSSPIITLTASSNANVSRTSPYRNGRILRDPSFSSYLTGTEETYVLNLRGKSVCGLSTSVAVPHDAEIDVFGAEKYFNESYDFGMALQCRQHEKHDPAEMSTVEDQLRIAMPSICSELTWNSQGVLLHNASGNQQPQRTRKKNILASIGCGCPCTDKNSISVNSFNRRNCSDKSTKTKMVRSGPQDFSTDVHFSFPVFNPKAGIQAGQDVDDSRKQKPFQIFGKYGFNSSDKLNMLSWNSSSGTGQEAVIIPSTSTDSDSDASSDLFEIESLPMDGCNTPGHGYAPSETSIEWSVITASAADFSVLSDWEELKSNATNTQHRPQKFGAVKETSKRRSNILSGCRNHKAVSVAGEHKGLHEKNSFDKRRPRQLRMGSLATAARFLDKDKMSDYNSRNMHCVLSKPQHGSAPHLLYT